MAERPFLRELVEGEPPCTYWLEWHCEPPPLRRAYRVIRAGWSEPGGDGIPVWRIDEIECAEVVPYAPQEDV